jgi:hypothetical protein
MVNISITASYLNMKNIYIYILIRSINTVHPIFVYGSDTNINIEKKFDVFTYSNSDIFNVDRLITFDEKSNLRRNALKLGECPKR